MKTEQNNLDRFKDNNPFKVPEGYMEGLTANIMSQLPEKPRQVEPVKISLMDRVRPWIYMAAVFAGMGLFFKAIVGTDSHSSKTDSLLVKNNVEASTAITTQTAEDEEYLEYIEDRYAGYILTGDIVESE